MGAAVVSVIWLAFLALVGIGLGVVWCGEQALRLCVVVDNEQRRRLYG